MDSYDYQGAEISLKNSSIEAPLALALIRYGKYRLARNYHQAFDAINPYNTEKVLPQEQLSLNPFKALNHLIAEHLSR